MMKILETFQKKNKELQCFQGNRFLKGFAFQHENSYNVKVIILYHLSRFPSLICIKTK